MGYLVYGVPRTYAQAERFFLENSRAFNEMADSFQFQPEEVPDRVILQRTLDMPRCRSICKLWLAVNPCTPSLLYRIDKGSRIANTQLLTSEYYLVVLCQFAFGSYTGLFQGVNTDLRCMAVAPVVQGCLICSASSAVETLVKALLKVMYVASRPNFLKAIAFWSFLMSGGMMSVDFVFIFLVNTNFEQQGALIMPFIYLIFQRLIMQPACVATGTILIIRSCTCKREDMTEKVAVGDGSMVKTALSMQDDSWEDEDPSRPMQTEESYTEPLSTNDHRDDREDEDPMQYGSWEDEDAFYLMVSMKDNLDARKDEGPGSRMNRARAKTLSKTEPRQKDAPAQTSAPNNNDTNKLEKHTKDMDKAATNTQGLRNKKKHMRPVLGGEFATERSREKGTVVVDKKGSDIPVVGKELKANTEESAAAAKIEKAAEKQRVPGGEGAKQISGKKGNAVVKKTDKDLVALRKEGTANTEEHAAAANIEKAAEKQRVPDGEFAKERSPQRGTAVVKEKDKDLAAVGKERIAK